MSAFATKGTIEVQVHRFRSETSQNLDAENRGWATTVAPAHNDDNTEYAWAFV